MEQNPNLGYMYRTAGGGLMLYCDPNSGPSLPATGLRSAPSEVGLFLVQNLDHNITNPWLNEVVLCLWNTLEVIGKVWAQGKDKM